MRIVMQMRVEDHLSPLIEQAKIMLLNAVEGDAVEPLPSEVGRTETIQSGSNVTIFILPTELMLGWYVGISLQYAESLRQARLTKQGA